jgi:branched-chain amino acid transport system ATP-binding protein
MSEPLLELKRVSKNFGGVQAVVDCSFTVQPGSITGLIGPNGAGKSTVTNLIAGELRPDTGEILLEGHNIAGLVAHQVARRGVARTFQLARELGRLTVTENLLFAPYPQRGEGLWAALFPSADVRRQEAENRARARELIELLRLGPLRNELAQNLSGGQKKLLELARAMMTRPKILLMDEPAAGVNPALVEQLLNHIRLLNQETGVTILIIEHNLAVIESLCQDVVVMAAGTVLARGAMADLRSNADVIEAYLGEGRAYGAV